MWGWRRRGAHSSAIFLHWIKNANLAKVQVRVGINAGPVIFKANTPARRGILGASATFRGFQRGRAPFGGEG